MACLVVDLEISFSSEFFITFKTNATLQRGFVERLVNFWPNARGINLMGHLTGRLSKLEQLVHCDESHSDESALMRDANLPVPMAHKISASPRSLVTRWLII